ncbi:MAG: hypothetical protein KME64_37440 [Scytonematopsis contorta HA4267-MV1]|nr:hypothetical protein [Scytonematopsis contorta HA4267-MV1]
MAEPQDKAPKFLKASKKDKATAVEINRKEKAALGQAQKKEAAVPKPNKEIPLPKKVVKESLFLYDTSKF